MPDFASIQSLQSNLIRKFITGSVFVTNDLDDALPARLTDATGDPIALTGAWEDLGMLSEDGAQFASDTTVSDTTAWQSVEPARSDLVSKSNTLAVACRETKRATIEAYTGKDLSEVTAAPGGAIVFDDDATPTFRFARVLAIGADLAAEGGPIYFGRGLHRARVTAVDDQAINKGDDGLPWGVTFSGFVDPVAKSSQRWYFEGPGWNYALAAAGFAPAATTP